MSQIPELLSPAGSLEKLKVSVLYGTDAVYVGGPNFGLRAASENLSEGELVEGVDFAHRHDAKVFVVLNGFLHDQDLPRLSRFCHFLQSIAVDAVICSDLGAMTTVQASSDLPIHLSTQASCLNSYSAKLWQKMGVSRIILGREVSLAEARAIKERVSGLEIELFIHGSMCTSYSGNCVISNYTAGRDSNRGGCAHSCRFQYTLEHKGHREQSLFMSSKDLRGIELLGQYIQAGVDSVKIEGRMKGPIYTATATKVYREALDYWGRGGGNGPELSFQLQQWQEELESFSHRDYTTASLQAPAGPDSIYNDREELRKRSYDVVGTVVAMRGEEAIISVKNAFTAESKLEALPFKGPPIPLPPQGMKSLGGKPITLARPSSLVRLPTSPIVSGQRGVERWNMVRKPCQ